MKKILSLAILTLLAIQVTAAEWMTDLDKAKAIAKKENKLVFIDFTGSDWCPPCIKLKKDVLSTAEFAKYAKEKFVLVELDYPRSKEQSVELKAANRELQQQFKIKGFPTVVILDGEGKEVLRKVGFGGEDIAGYLKQFEGLKK